MSKLDHALALAAKGFWVFPLQANGKKPPKDMHFKELATRDPAAIAAMFGDKDFNVGIYTGKFGDDGGALCVVDVDNKGTKRGDDALIKLELEGFELPDTAMAETPTGGSHLFFSVGVAVRQGANVLGDGLDIRSRGGYVVGAGSTIEGKTYRWLHDSPIASAPEWLTARCGVSRRGRSQHEDQPVVQVEQPRAVDRGRRFLISDAPLAVEGAGGDDLAYKVACRLKDFGINRDDALQLMVEFWNDRCSPPWELDDLWAKVTNAFSYGQEPQGAAAPEADFEPVHAADPITDGYAPDAIGHPFEELNKDHAFVLAGGGDHILWETTDPKGRFKLVHLNTGSFHRKFAPHTMTVGKKTSPVTEEWMTWKGRRSYDGLVFMPEQQAPERFYNLWRGFAVEPLAPDDKPTPDMQHALDAFLDHALQNICRGDEKLCRWLIGFFAHMVQRPWEKPLTALVMKGEKGVGKNALVERVADLLGCHAMVADDDRYLISNFNDHLENMLFLILDEASWAGDKKAEGRLKGLITGRAHNIEPKGEKRYEVDNLTRVAILGNADWVVPASHDERRFAVFDVGDGRKQDRDFFRTMRERMERGGYRLLLRYLLDFDTSQVDVNDAPRTKGLLDQKLNTLDPLPAWWLSCLAEGKIVASDFGAEWPDQVERDRFRESFRRYAQNRGVRARLPDDIHIGKLMSRMCPAMTSGRVKTGYVYRFPPLDDCRRAWNAFIGQEQEWPE